MKMDNCGLQDIYGTEPETAELMKEVERIFRQGQDMGGEDGDDIKPALWRAAIWLLDIVLNIVIAFFPVCAAVALIILLKKGGKRCLVWIKNL